MRKNLIITVAGNISDAASDSAIGGAEVELEGERAAIRLRSDEMGEFTGRLDSLSDYTAVARQAGWIPAVQNFTTRGIDEATEIPLNLKLRKGKYLMVQGQTVNKATGDPVGGASLRVFESTTSKIIKNMQSRSDGKFYLVIEEGTDMNLIATGAGYFSSRMELPAFDQPGDSVITVRLELVPYEVGALVKIIQYPYRESNLILKARKELNEIVAFMLDNPTATVELSSFTDSRGSDRSNQSLSEARAKSAVDYIVSRGIAGNRISSAGYGETRLLNECKDNVECSEEAHQVNRRTEINVVKIEAK
jgi:outer membrane protein OmpA-like peptidoglycan-associated protein